VPDGGCIVEIGSHRGKSTIVLARAAPGATVVAIDPFDDPRWGGGPESRSIFLDNLTQADVHNVEPRATLSTELRPTWDEQIDLLYVDGAHDVDTVRDDLEWTRHLRPGAEVLVHDAFSSVGVTRAVYERLLRRRDLDYRGRERSLATFVTRRSSAGGLLHAVASGTWFARNLLVKVCIQRGWRGGARLLGCPEMQYPF
jgi:predicted O-methyltransferase YrrM